MESSNNGRTSLASCSGKNNSTHNSTHNSKHSSKHNSTHNSKHSSKHNSSFQLAALSRHLLNGHNCWCCCQFKCCRCCCWCRHHLNSTSIVEMLQRLYTPFVPDESTALVIISTPQQQQLLMLRHLHQPSPAQHSTAQHSPV
jgi:hypothetical protein